jgi:CRISPR-associated protein Cmr2
MTFDLYANLDEKQICPNEVNESGLVSGFVDGCIIWSSVDNRSKIDARNCYTKNVTKLKIQPCTDLEPDFTSLPDSTWFAMDVAFELASPWYSKDDRPFHVLDNPVRKDRVFGVPVMSAASWKGALRWACRMRAGLSEHLESHEMSMNGWSDPPWIIHLFGNEKGEGAQFQSGALVCYPTWFDKIGFEVINPHQRETRAGTSPILYEVVPKRTKGKLRLLYAPLPGEMDNDQIAPDDFIGNLIDSIKALLETYGISAKRTAGWGTARIKEWSGYVKAAERPPQVELRSNKKAVHSLQDLGALFGEQPKPGFFHLPDAGKFKTELKSRIGQMRGDR